MTTYYMDSSALVKHYLRETGSSWVSGLLAPNVNSEIFIVAITGLEIVAAISRRARGGTITIPDAIAACTLFRSELLSNYQEIEVTGPLISQAMTIAQAHGLRGYDALQLAAGLQVNRLCIANGLQNLVFISSDVELNAAALSEGLAVDDPNTHP